MIEQYIQQFTADAVSRQWWLPRTTAGNQSLGFELATGSSFVLRITRNDSFEGLNQQRGLQDRLIEHGIRTPGFLRLRSGAFVGIDRDQLFTVSALIPGHRPVAYTSALVRSFGTTLADLHTAWKDFVTADTPTQWLQPRNGGGGDQSLDAYASARNLALVLYGEIDIAAMPMANIHGDLHPDNVFASRARVSVVFDLETAQFAPRLFDLARTSLTLHKRSGLPLATILDQVAAAYESQSGSKLTPEERRSTRTVVAYVASQTAAHIIANGNIESGLFYLRLARDWSDSERLSLGRAA